MKNNIVADRLVLASMLVVDTSHTKFASLIGKGEFDNKTITSLALPSKSSDTIAAAASLLILSTTSAA